MKISVRGKNIEITEAIESKISDKLSKLDKYFIVSDNVEAKVLCRVYPYGQKLEVTILTEYVLLRAEVVDSDLYTAMDLVVDKLEGQIRKYKTRLSRKSKDNKLAFNLSSIEDVETDDDVLVKVKSITPKPMDMEEAIMQMELIGHSFFVYRDAESDSISIVYRRNDGDYGLIETD
ncbi:MAG: ribosome hibernation-promoting factor, HPF/YfiA family [Thomasclavelia spiroformis]|uniref:ribosome hibernation-promoting factor, HPF/YfiA family n=1 Tax=Thomasclavelia spiroformis TaxID=29348 RepID=UPI0039943297